MDTFIEHFRNIYFYPITLEFVIAVVAAILLLMVSAFASASEVSFFSLSPSEIDELKERNDKKSNTILNLTKQSEKLLATILILNNLVNVSIVILISYACSIVIDFSGAPVLEFIFQTIIITFVLLLFGEIMPKIYATQNPLKVALKVAPIFPFLLKLFSPFSFILVGSTSIVNKRVAKYRKTNISVDELSQALELTGENITEDKDILEGIVKFGNISVAEAMTPRTNITGVDISSSYKDVIQKINENGYSRMPVYANSPDDIKGILYIKDLLPYLSQKDNFRWQALIRPAYFVPEVKKIDDLLKEFQQNKTHMAVVIDEFGGTSGIITMEDILEEIIGEISDEYDADEKKQCQKVDNNTYICEAQILLNDFFRATSINEEDFNELTSEAESLAGMILELKGEIPHEKDIIEFKHYTFEILQADDRKIETVKFHIK